MRDVEQLAKAILRPTERLFDQKLESLFLEPEIFSDWVHGSQFGQSTDGEVRLGGATPDASFERGFAAYFIFQKMSGRLFVGLKPHAPSV